MIIAGFGFRTAATAASLGDALAQAAGTHRVDALAAPADKIGADCLKSLAQSLFLPVFAVTADALQGADTPTRSAISLTRRQTGSVAEAAALAAAGPGARLIAPRRISADRMATAALAQNGDPA